MLKNKLRRIKREFSFLFHKIVPENPQKVFSDIFKRNAFKGTESISGPGSDLIQTSEIRASLPSLILKYKIETLLDAPCGDFYWMSKTGIKLKKYIGVDIVKEIIDENNRQYCNEVNNFKCLDIINDKLPQVDLIICRDCLVHFPFKAIKDTVKNIISSKSKYLFTTTFPNVKENRDIIMGEWRPVNLNLQPFNFPEPLYLLDEKSKEIEGIKFKKSLALWLIKDLERII